jgi:flagellin
MVFNGEKGIGGVAMSLRINNYAGQYANNNLRRTSADLTNSLNKLSTGRRINRAADDASGMVISDSLNSQARGLGQSIRNANDSISLLQVADGALQESSSLLQQIREKAIQAASDVQTTESRQAIQNDIDKMLESLRGISDTTSFNGQKLLSGNFTDKQTQVGAESGQAISMSISSTSPGQLGNLDGKTLNDINVLTFDGAQEAIDLVDAALTDLNTIRSDIGSSQNQFTSTVNNMMATQVNVQAAESQIGDLDFAEETMNLARMKVLQQAQVFAQTQAGKVNESQIKSLLQG